jgi:hypothetical protein
VKAEEITSYDGTQNQRRDEVTGCGGKIRPHVSFKKSVNISNI